VGKADKVFTAVAVVTAILFLTATARIIKSIL